MMPTASRFRESRRFGGNSSVGGFENNDFLKHVWMSQEQAFGKKSPTWRVIFRHEVGVICYSSRNYPTFFMVWRSNDHDHIVFSPFRAHSFPFSEPKFEKNKYIGLFWIQVAGLTQKPLRLGVEFQPQMVERFWWLWSSIFFRPWLEDSGTDVSSQQFDTLFDTRFGWVWRSSPHRKDLSRGFNVQLQHLRRTKQQHIICIY